MYRQYHGKNIFITLRGNNNVIIVLGYIMFRGGKSINRV